MTRRVSALPLVLPPRSADLPAHRWLYTALQRAILSGALRPGARLPATRELASHYGLARGTIVSAFDQLRVEGYLEGRTGSGTFVARELPELLRGAGPASRPSPARPPLRRLSAWARRVQPFPHPGPRPMRAFRANQPALDLFPTTLWAQVASRRARRATTQQLEGDPPLGY